MADTTGITTATFTNRNGRRDRSGRWEENPNDPGPSNGQQEGEQDDVLRTDDCGGTAAYEYVAPQGEAVTWELPANLETSPLGTRWQRRR